MLENNSIQFAIIKKSLCEWLWITLWYNFVASEAATSDFLALFHGSVSKKKF